MARLVWYNFFSHKTAMKNSICNKTIDTAKEQVDNCSGFLVLTSRDAFVHSLFECGKLYQRIGLMLTELDIVHHTMSQLMEEESWSSQIRTQLNLDDPVQFIMRVGNGEKSQPSARRPASGFIVMWVID
ncbi:MAG: hypothetical protein GF313_17095 [Caldithrix sp.]|nr:hypothetical protein [Caldithrix sp.]